ncbi:nuclear transport factor 2 family protein [Hoyosella sp. YIM 151337]|uniref:nuclear transport factor 2 family protein n=1 Tax=Hoyosella sp. YIM 151337 TaxID=2992742 RepID=UPI002235467D|nr:nuclear transport factor 2 family protein [Hoyosella sp. YIM 151337]MCW4355720.1 nuclear transport factor 2 family protein [Hoyosella sp. YIM 151337]
MAVTVSWDENAGQPPARVAALRSMRAVDAGNKEEWLALFAANAVVEDPVGPSGFDPAAQGHHGHRGIAAFWDTAIAKVDRFDFTMRDSHACGNEVANVGTITSYLPGGYRVDTDLITVYKVDDDGKILSMRAFWEVERAAATARHV